MVVSCIQVYSHSKQEYCFKVVRAVGGDARRRLKELHSDCARGINSTPVRKRARKKARAEVYSSKKIRKIGGTLRTES